MRLRHALALALLVVTACVRLDLEGIGGLPDDSGAVAETSPTCSDGVRNGDESDVDCGGTCVPCSKGKGCKRGEDCESLVCVEGACAGSSCTNGVKDGTETDVDCGGDCRTKCDTGKTCAKGEDCASRVCDGTACRAPTCKDGVKNGDETDVDCGGSCPTCALAKECVEAKDCESRFCSGRCVPPPSCKALLGKFPGIASGPQTIDVDGSGPLPATSLYCDMSTLGGGWTFVGHLNGDSPGGTFFQADMGVYSADRADGGLAYGKGSLLGKLAPTSTLVLVDGNDPVAADAAKKLLVFDYPAGHLGFTTGPLPCAGLSGFSVRVGLSGTAFSTDANTCSATNWYVRSATGFVLALDGTGIGAFWGALMGGDNTWGHDTYWFVR